MGFTLPGMPTEISEKIELPDMAELLNYPMFQNSPIEAVRKYGTEFQKKLLDLTPIRGDMAQTNVYSMVQMLAPHTRSATTYNPATDGSEWHIDGLGDYDYQLPSERVHLLLSECTSMTEFNTYPLKFNISASLHKYNFYQILNDRLDEIIPTKVEGGRIYTFHNELHRATPPRRIEFRYIWRIRETNKPDDMRPVDNAIASFNTVFDVRQQRDVQNIKRENGRLIINLPSL